jgi:hypothetical protein
MLEGLGIPFKSFSGSKVDSCILSKRNILDPTGYLKQTSLPPSEGTYKLDNCILVLDGPRGASHAIAGIIVGTGKQMILDSEGFTFEHTWTSDTLISNVQECVHSYSLLNSNVH